MSDHVFMSLFQSRGAARGFSRGLTWLASVNVTGVNNPGPPSAAIHAHLPHLRKSATSSKLGSVADSPTILVISWVDSTWRMVLATMDSRTGPLQRGGKVGRWVHAHVTKEEAKD